MHKLVVTSNTHDLSYSTLCNLLRPTSPRRIEACNFLLKELSSLSWKSGKKEINSVLWPQSSLHNFRQALPKIKNIFNTNFHQPTHRQSRRSRFVITIVTFFISSPPPAVFTYLEYLARPTVLHRISRYMRKCNYIRNKGKASPAPIFTKQRYTQIPYTELHPSGIINVGRTNRNEFGHLGMASAALILKKLRKITCY